jgi:hypothetical protein
VARREVIYFRQILILRSCQPLHPSKSLEPPQIQLLVDHAIFASNFRTMELPSEKDLMTRNTPKNFCDTRWIAIVALNRLKPREKVPNFAKMHRKSIVCQTPKLILSHLAQRSVRFEKTGKISI